MNENENNYNLFEADLYNYFYMVEKNRQKNSLKTVFIEAIKIVASIFITLIINLISKKFKIDEINVTIGVTVLFVSIYTILQIITFSSKKFYNAVYNKRSRPEIEKINELLFHKVSLNYLSKAINVVNNIEKIEKNSQINYIKIALKYFEKSKNAFNEIFPNEESNRQGRREKANAVYLSRIGYPEIKLYFENSKSSLNKLLQIAIPISTDFENDISELITYFQSKEPRINALETIFNKLNCDF